MIGFSRGAFTVRAIAQLINDISLLTKAGLKYLPRLYKVWKSTGDGPLHDWRQRLLRRGLLREGTRVKICAVWDTVGSLGFPMPGPLPQWASKKLAFVNSRYATNIDVAIQALALNERRKHFMATVWRKPPAPQILKQCWFLGAHSDVGGGNTDPGLANLTLVWMIAQLNDHIGFDLERLPDFAMDRSIFPAEEYDRHKEFSVKINVSAIPGMSLGWSASFSTPQRQNRERIHQVTAFPVAVHGLSASTGVLNVSSTSTQFMQTRERIRKGQGKLTRVTGLDLTNILRGDQELNAWFLSSWRFSSTKTMSVSDEQRRPVQEQ